MERIGDLGDIVEGVVDGVAIGARQIEHPVPTRSLPATGDMERGAPVTS
jgi:hypothetical protein